MTLPLTGFLEPGHTGQNLRNATEMIFECVKGALRFEMNHNRPAGVRNNV